MGKAYTQIVKELLEELNFKVIVPPPNSDKTIQFGVKHSAEMYCFPYKATLGNFWESLELGANTLLMWNTNGICRLKHYYIHQELVLKDIGYKFEMCDVNQNLLFKLKYLNPKLSYYQIIKALINAWKKIKKIDIERQKFSKDKINIGLVGEVWTVIEESCNYNLVERLKSFGANVYYTITIQEMVKSFLENILPFAITKKKYKKEASKYLNGALGGHGYENLYNTLWLIDQKIDGIIHLMPLSCMPESTVEVIINKFCSDAKTPLLRLPIDETNSEANIRTRVETFVEIIKRRKNG